jgi:hypothetical protein
MRTKAVSDHPPDCRDSEVKLAWIVQVTSSWVALETKVNASVRSAVAASAPRAPVATASAVATTGAATAAARFLTRPVPRMLPPRSTKS